MAHEDLSRTRHIEGSSDRTFGLVFAGMFLFVACWPLSRGEAMQWPPLGAAAMFSLAALAKPALLAGLNRLWTRFGVLLGSVASPIALGILFYCVFTPLGLAIRLSGKDPLRLRFDPGADSYWIPRNPPGPPPGSMNNQF
jgi:hypothetical protein